MSAQKVIHKNLWISQVIHALKVAGFWVIHALKVAGSRINGCTPNKYLYLPVSKVFPVIRAAPSVDNPSGLTTIRLAPATNF
jgi:hypothetical protein